MLSKMLMTMLITIMMTQVAFSQTINVEKFALDDQLDQILEVIIDLDDKPLIIGKGVNLITSQPRNDCVDYESIENEGSTAKNVTFEMIKITDRETLASELNVSASAKFGKSSSGKASFLKKTNVSKYSLHLLVKVAVQMPPLVLKRPKLHQDVIEMLKTSGDSMERFRKVCGDEFISSITRGGEFFAIITVNTENSTSHKKAEQALNASYKIYSGSGEFKKALEEIKEHSEVSISQYVKGGTPLISSDVDQMVLSATEFAKTIDVKNAYPYQAETSSYEMLFNFPNTSVIDIENQKFVLDKLGEKLSSFQNKLSDVEYVLNQESQFINPNIELLTAASNQISENINKVSSAASTCFKSFSNCKLPTDIKPVTFTLPERKDGITCKLARVKACGVDKYKIEASKACIPKVLNRGTGKVCGLKQYKLNRSSACGVELYKQKMALECPGGLYYRDGKPCDSGDRVISSTSDETGTMYRCERKTKCRLAKFGVETYKQCRSKAHGAEWKSCSHINFGVQEYNMCEDRTHGVALYKQCMVDIATENVCPVN